MDISPDQWIIWQGHGFTLNATIMFTWVIMAVLTLGSILATAGLSGAEKLSPWQNLLEVVVTTIRDQIRDVGTPRSDRFLPFIGTLFLFIAVSNTAAIIPGYKPPTGSLSTTTALALCVLTAVPLFGIAEKGLFAYLANYFKPTFFMLPFNIIGELSRTIALAVRLYGNIMSGTVVAGILISIAPFFFPILMQLLGLITGLVQSYIFAVLAMVYIASAMRGHGGEDGGNDDNSLEAPSATAGAAGTDSNMEVTQ